MRDYTYSEKVQLRTYASARYGNKKRRKPKMKNGVLLYNCGCCELIDRRREIAQRIADDEMQEYR